MSVHCWNSGAAVSLTPLLLRGMASNRVFSTNGAKMAMVGWTEAAKGSNASGDSCCPRYQRHGSAAKITRGKEA
jgi:hypothetical protein